MRALLIASACLAAIAVPVVAQQTMSVPGAKDPKRVTAGTYTVDSGHTQVEWRVNHLGFNDYFGLFGSATGTLTLDPAKPAASTVSIEIPINKLATSHDGLTKHMMSADFFDAEKFPTATFKSTSVTVHGEHAIVAGNLTIKGVTKPTTLDVQFSGAGKMPEQMGGKEGLGFHATTKIKRSDFGISYGIPLVPDEVPLQISVAFIKQ